MTEIILKQLWFDYCNDCFKEKGIAQSALTGFDECFDEIEKATSYEFARQMEDLLLDLCSNSEMEGFINGLKVGLALLRDI